MKTTRFTVIDNSNFFAYAFNASSDYNIFKGGVDLTMADEPTKTMGRVPGMLEQANQFLWDSELITSSATSLTMFQTPQGQNDIAGSSKSKLITNMTQAGVLPVPKMMRIFALRFILSPACVIADAKLILAGTYLEFWLNDKVVLDGPVFMFAQGCGVGGVAQTTANATTFESAHNGDISPRSIFTLKHSIDIGVQTPFYIKVLMPSALSTLSASTRFWLTLEGELWRAVS